MNETDRELLEWAARAAGYKVKWFDGATPWHYTGFLKEDPQLTHYNDIPVQLHWNPLKDSGQALELAVRCAQLFGFHRFFRAWLVAMGTESGDPDDPVAATRRAIVRAAAEIGKAMV